MAAMTTRTPPPTPMPIAAKLLELFLLDSSVGFDVAKPFLDDGLLVGTGSKTGETLGVD